MLQKESEEIYNYILNKINKNSINSNNISSADEILKYKKLLNYKIITEAKFEKKKEELLK